MEYLALPDSDSGAPRWETGGQGVVCPSCGGYEISALTFFSVAGDQWRPQYPLQSGLENPPGDKSIQTSRCPHESPRCGVSISEVVCPHRCLSLLPAWWCLSHAQAWTVGLSRESPAGYGWCGTLQAKPLVTFRARFCAQPALPSGFMSGEILHVGASAYLLSDPLRSLYDSCFFLDTTFPYTWVPRVGCAVSPAWREVAVMSTMFSLLPEIRAGSQWMGFHRDPESCSLGG